MLVLISLIILLIIGFYLTIKVNGNSNIRYSRNSLFTILIASLILNILYFNLELGPTNYSFIEMTFYILTEIFIGFITIVLLIINLLLRFLGKRRKVKININIKEIVMSLIIVLFIFLSALALDNLRLKIIEKKENKIELIHENKAIEILNERYGYGEYEIVNNRYGCIYITDMLPSCKAKGYTFDIKTKYMNSKFKFDIEKDTYKVYKDEFLDNYYMEKFNTKDIDKYIEKYIMDKSNKTLSKKFNSKIKYSIKKDYKQEYYGEIPNVEELSKKYNIDSVEITIYDIIENEKELEEYLLELTKYYMLNIPEARNLDFTYKLFNSNLHNGNVIIKGDKEEIVLNISGQNKFYKYENIINIIN